MVFVVAIASRSCFVTALKPGTVLGNHRYELVSCLGKGGQAQVWEARQGGIGGFSKIVVLKILEFDVVREKQRSLLLHEARIVSQLQHPNLVSIFDVDEVPPYLYIAMEYVDGHDIEDFMAHVIASVGRRSLPWQVALTIFRQVCRGLYHAHTATDAYGQPFRLIHRDLKPTNLLIGRNGLVKIIDFGIAKSTANTLKTQTGIIRGTPAYMSPEQIQSKELDERSDLYSLGVILYEICAGINPFASPDTFTTMIQVTQMPAPSLREFVDDCPPALEELLASLLSKHPEDRPPDARAVYRQIEQILRERNYPQEQEDLADWLTLFRHSPPAAFNPFGFSADPRRTYLDSSSFRPPVSGPSEANEGSTDEGSTDEGHTTTTSNPVLSSSEPSPPLHASSLPRPPMLPAPKLPVQTVPSLPPHESISALEYIAQSGASEPLRTEKNSAPSESSEPLRTEKNAARYESSEPLRTEKNAAQSDSSWLDAQGRVMIDRGMGTQKREGWGDISSASTKTNIALMQGSPRDTIEQSEFFKMTMEIGPKPPALVERGERLSVAPADAQLNAATLTNLPFVQVDDNGQISIGHPSSLHDSISVRKPSLEKQAHQEQEETKSPLYPSVPSDDDLIALDEQDLITATGMHPHPAPANGEASRSVLIEKKAVGVTSLRERPTIEHPSSQRATTAGSVSILVVQPPAIESLSEQKAAEGELLLEPVEKDAFFTTESDDRISPLYGMFATQHNDGFEASGASVGIANKTEPEKKAVLEDVSSGFSAQRPAPRAFAQQAEPRAFAHQAESKKHETLGGSLPKADPLRATIEYQPSVSRSAYEDPAFFSESTGDESPRSSDGISSQQSYDLGASGVFDAYKDERVDSEDSVARKPSIGRRWLLWGLVIGLVGMGVGIWWLLRW